MATLEANIRLWSAETRAAQQWITDIFTRVHTTCDIPANAVFGPCELKHTSVYDSIAFIALKSMDRRTTPYILRVDTSVHNMRHDGPMWLRLVQSARNAEEQNLEAYVKNGQLFFRVLRRIKKEEEMLVWYGKDLAKLLLLNPLEMECKGSPPYMCANCNQHFESEFPFLAHWRFLCTRRQPENSHTKPGKEYTTHVKPDSLPAFKLKTPDGGKPATDFHNLARDMENKTGSSNHTACSSLKRKHSTEVEEIGSDSQPLMIKPEPLNRGQCAFRMIRQPSSVSSPQSSSKRSISAKNGKTQLNLKHDTEVLRSSPPNQSSQHGRDPAGQQRDLKQALIATLSASSSEESSTETPVASAFSLVTASKKMRPFLQPPPSVPQSTPLLARAKLPGSTDLQSALLQGRVIRQEQPLYSTALWPKTPAKPMQIQMPPSRVLLSPSVSPLALHSQNWCAKCNVSFRKTSDLVHHMRSHHTRALSAQPAGLKQLRDERHKCPTCSEVFRQSHHLARHLRSHT